MTQVNAVAITIQLLSTQIAALVIAELTTSGALTTAVANVFAGLPTTEPSTSGVLWLNGGLVQIS